jgi:glycine hydroxymethyltransferase
VVNAVNAEKDWAWLSAVNDRSALIDSANPSVRLEAPCRLRNLKDPSSGPDMKIDIAIQGPCSAQILSDAADDETAAKVEVLAKSCNVHGRIAGIDVIISRTGYTGEEYGYEIYMHPDKAVALWDALSEAGQVWGMRFTGLGARDSTRTEAGLPLYGHELAGQYEVDPIEAGYGFFVKWHKPFFVGRAALMERSARSARTVMRFQAGGAGTRMSKTSDPVVNRKERVIGYVTSCALAGERQVGMAIVDRRQAKPGSRIGFFSLPRKGKSKQEKPRDALAMGDSVTIPIEAMIIERFPEA